jgi:hypothetical protein
MNIAFDLTGLIQYENSIKENFMIEIDDDVPAPPCKGRPSKYPFRDLQPGQSIFVPLANPPISYWRMMTDYKLVKRKVTEKGIKGARIWRIA